MIYINQVGHCELGRGETLGEAIDDAIFYSDIEDQDIPEYRGSRHHMDGDVVWVEELWIGYND